MQILTKRSVKRVEIPHSDLWDFTRVQELPQKHTRGFYLGKHDEAADMLNVSRSGVQRAKKVLDEGSPIRL